MSLSIDDDDDDGLGWDQFLADEDNDEDNKAEQKTSQEAMGETKQQKHNATNEYMNKVVDSRSKLDKNKYTAYDCFTYLVSILNSFKTAEDLRKKLREAKQLVEQLIKANKDVAMSALQDSIAKNKITKSETESIAEAKKNVRMK